MTTTYFLENDQNIHRFEGDASIRMDIQDLSPESQSLVFWSNDVSDEIFDEIKNKFPQLALLSSEQVSVDLNELKNMTIDERQKFHKNCLSSLHTARNFVLLENLIHTSLELKKLYLKNRDVFFEELWKILKSNFMIDHLKIIYPGLSDEKILYQVLEGDHSFNLRETSEEEKNLITGIAPLLQSGMSDLKRHDSESVTMMTTMLGESPFICLAQGQERLGPFQTTLIKSLFNSVAQLLEC